MALATFVLPVAVADAQTMAEAVDRIEAALGMPLLLRAVRSRSVPLVRPCSVLQTTPCPEADDALHQLGDGPWSLT